MVDINAKAEGEPDRQQLTLMLPTLLGDRFQLKVHHETREGNVHSLAVSKNGAKLKDPKGGGSSFIPTGRTGAPDQPAIAYILWGQNAAMPAFTAQLSNQLGRPVVDRTGIPSRFDIRPGIRRRRRPEQRRSIHFAAIQEQLGLKLEAAGAGENSGHRTRREANGKWTGYQR
jgi:uncharacterized protein (TIGR03435 family)